MFAKRSGRSPGAVGNGGCATSIPSECSRLIWQEEDRFRGVVLNGRRREPMISSAPVEARGSAIATTARSTPASCIPAGNRAIGLRHADAGNLTEYYLDSNRSSQRHLWVPIARKSSLTGTESPRSISIVEVLLQVVGILCLS